MLSDRTFFPAVFRVFIGLILIFDIVTGFFFTDVFYTIPDYQQLLDARMAFLPILRENIYLFLSIYLFAVMLWLFGIGKELTAMVVFLLYALDFWLLSPGLYWGDYILRTTLVYFVFVNSFQYLTLSKGTIYIGRIHKLALLAIMVHLCVIYLENAYFKLLNPEWRSGYAMAYFFQYSEVLDIFGVGKFIQRFQPLDRIATWSVLLFQLTFPLAIWVKRLKFWWISFGIFLHVLMAVTLQVYKFEFILILLYGFFITDTEWQYILRKLRINIDILNGER